MVPGFWEMRKCRYRIISNWSSFFSELKFKGCVQKLHIPYLAPDAMPTDILIIFRPTVATLGAFVVTRKLSDEMLTKGADTILGDYVLPPVT